MSGRVGCGLGKRDGFMYMLPFALDTTMTEGRQSVAPTKFPIRNPQTFQNDRKILNLKKEVIIMRGHSTALNLPIWRARERGGAHPLHVASSLVANSHLHRPTAPHTGTKLFGINFYFHLYFVLENL